MSFIIKKSKLSFQDIYCSSNERTINALCGLLGWLLYMLSELNKYAAIFEKKKTELEFESRRCADN